MDLDNNRRPQRKLNKPAPVQYRHQLV
ncbi:hypothetical protein [Paenibacillus mendelii]|uniref:Uncharacterized protein n=1 Tax=Paenibacillus mendelii TaxID=206163 RepID=A0ABV6JM16_9BACL